MASNNSPTEWEIFTKNYADFCDILQHEDELLPQLVNKGIILINDLEDIKSKNIFEKGSTLLKHISGPLKTGHTDGFYVLLEVMKNHGKLDTKKFAKKIMQGCPKDGNSKLQN